ncbi:MAG: hypothetical protein IIY20_04660, partial [Bifidobacteriaceae bacterium]|nr:hypothetical protein [Bifidobacteriaceae bacterium]
MNFKKLLGNMSIAFLAQGVSLLLSVVLSLVVPKVLSGSQFGYWQLFLFYSSYCGFFHFGLNDGVYLIHGGESYNELDKKNVGSQLKLGIIYQAIISSLIVAAAFFEIGDKDRLFVIVSTAIYLCINNAAFFIGFVFQMTNETKLFSISVLADKVFFLLALVFLIMFEVRDYKIYTILYIVSRSVALAYCFYRGKEILFAKYLGFKKTFPLVWESIRVGLKLTVANIASLLIIGIMRFMVDKAWGIETFGQLSLALSLENFFLLFIQQISMVLFPALRQADKKILNSFFSVFESLLTFLMPLAYILYFPIVFIVGMWLPNYSDSLKYFGLLLPICVFDSRMNLLCITYLKVLRKESLLFIINVFTVLGSGILSAAGIYLCKNIEVTIMLVVIAVVLRSIMSEVILAKYMESKSVVKSLLAALAITVIFCATQVYCNSVIS